MRRSTPARLAWPFAVLGLLACAGEGPGPQAQQPKEQERSSVKIEIKFPKDRFVVGEDLPMGVEIANDGKAPVRLPDPFNNNNWQPTYSISGPAFPDGMTFSARSALRGDKRPNPEGIAPAMAEIGAGQTIADDLPLRQWLKLSKPGKYELTARLDWEGLSIQSKPASFTLEALSIRSISVGEDFGLPTAQNISMLLLHEGGGQSGGKKRLYDANFTETRPDLGETALHSMGPQAETGPGASDAMAPWTNYDRMGSLHFWRAWREGPKLLAATPAAKNPLSLDLEGEPKFLVRPALMAASGELDIFAALSGEPAISLARFVQPGKGGTGPAPRVLWRHPLESAPLSGRCILDPQGKKERRHVALLSAAQDAVRLDRLVCPADGAKPAADFALVPNAAPLATSEPALRVDAEGTLHVAALVWTNAKERAFALAEFKFEEGSPGAAKPNLTDLGLLDADAKAAAIQFQLTPADEPRIEWALLLVDGRVVSGGAQGRRQAFQPAAPPSLPLEIVPLSQATYLLLIDPEKGPRLAAI